MAYVVMVELSRVSIAIAAIAGACASEQNFPVFPGDSCWGSSSLALGKSLDVRRQGNFSSKWVSCCGFFGSLSG